ncbi:MAG: hypothetical protein OHK0039_34950 [Bacteroidia bacterium]
MKTFKQLLTLLLVSLVAVQGFAQGLEVSPVRLDFSLEPGGNESRTITVRNTTNKRASYTLSAADWFLDEEGNVVRMEPGQLAGRSCASWISFSPSLIELEANSAKEVTVTMRVPGNEKKTKWAITYIALKREQEAAQADKEQVAMGIQVDQTIGVFVTQSPRSNREASAKLLDFEDVTEAGSTVRTFAVRAKNTGDKIIDCNMYLVVSDLQNATERKLEPVSFRVLPDGAIRQELVMPNDLKKGSYLVAAILDYGPNFPLEGVQMQLDVK